MRKFYVSCGGLQRLVLAHTPPQACMKTFGWFVDEGKGHIGLLMRVSERGFDVHEDDENYFTSQILALICYSNEYNAARQARLDDGQEESL